MGFLLQIETSVEEFAHQEVELGHLLVVCEVSRLWLLAVQSLHSDDLLKVGSEANELKLTVEINSPKLYVLLRALLREVDRLPVTIENDSNVPGSFFESSEQTSHQNKQMLDLEFLLREHLFVVKNDDLETEELDVLEESVFADYFSNDLSISNHLHKGLLFDSVIPPIVLSLVCVEFVEELCADIVNYLAFIGKNVFILIHQVLENLDES